MMERLFYFSLGTLISGGLIFGWNFFWPRYQARRQRQRLLQRLDLGGLQFFLENECWLSDLSDREPAHIGCAELYQAYLTWAKKEKSRWQHRLLRRVFDQAMKTQGYELGRILYSKNRCWLGLRLRLNALEKVN